MTINEFFGEVLKAAGAYYGSAAPKEIAEIPTESWDDCVFGEHFVFPHSLPLDNNVAGYELRIFAAHNVKKDFECSVDLYKHLESDPDKVLAPQGLYAWGRKDKLNGLCLNEHRFARTTIFSKRIPEEKAYLVIQKHSGTIGGQFGGHPLAIITW